jgi:hypothetical protein
MGTQPSSTEPPDEQRRPALAEGSRARRVSFTCPDSTGRLVRVRAWPAIDGTVMVLAPPGGIRLSQTNLQALGDALPMSDSTNA